MQNQRKIAFEKLGGGKTTQRESKNPGIKKNRWYLASYVYLRYTYNNVICEAVCKLTRDCEHKDVNQIRLQTRRNRSVDVFGLAYCFGYARDKMKEDAI